MTDKISNTINNHLRKISVFIEDADLESARGQLNSMFYAANTSEHLEQLGIEAREDLTHFYIILLGLVEGIHLIGDSLLELFNSHNSDTMNDLKITCPYGCKHTQA
jgi:hypothetical protein